MENVKQTKDILELEKDEIKQKIEFFCKKYNANFDSNLIFLFDFKFIYNKEAFNTFCYSCEDHPNNKKEALSESSKEIVIAKYNRWKHLQQKYNFAPGYDFDEELKDYLDMTDIFEFMIELWSLFCNKDMKPFLETFKFKTF